MSLKTYIIEDEELQLLTLEASLQAECIDVLGYATSGEYAIRELRERKSTKTLPDLLFLDINLEKSGGEMTGIDILAALWDIDIKIPFVVVTQYKDYRDKLLPFRNRMIHFIPTSENIVEGVIYSLDQYLQHYGYIQEKNTERIYFKDIICVTTLKYARNLGETGITDGNNIVIYIENQKVSEGKLGRIQLCEKNIKWFCEQCKLPDILRVSDSFAINKSYIERRIGQDQFELKYMQGHSFKVGGKHKYGNYMKSFLNWLSA